MAGSAATQAPHGAAMAAAGSTDNPISRAAGHAAIALGGLPPALATVILIVASIVVAVIVHAVLMRLVPRRLRARHGLIDVMIERLRRVLFALVQIVMLSGVVPAAPLSPAQSFLALHVLSAVFILILGWAAVVTIETVSDDQLSRRRDSIQTDITARRHATQWQVLRRTSHVLIVLITLAAAMMVFPAVRQYGVSLLASAGAAGIVVGFAARPVLSNLIAGIQIAITQPLRVEDAVVINGQWGWIEEITATYVVVRIWNLQRMIVPLAWLLEQPFQNWTRNSSDLLGQVTLHVDYTVPMERLREKLNEIVKQAPQWDGKVVVLQVVEALPTTIHLRALVSAPDSGKAWDLRCFVREKLITFLQAEYPHALPRQRIEVERPAAAKAEPAAEDGAKAAE